MKDEVAYNFEQLIKKPDITTPNIIQLWEREYNIFTMSSWVKMLEIMNAKKLGDNSFTSFITFYSNGVSQHFRSSTEEVVFEKTVGDKFIGNEKLRKQVVDSHTQNAKHLMELFKEIETESEFSSEFVADLNLSFGKFSGANTCIQRSVDYIASQENRKSVAEELSAQRIKYEHVMAFFDKHFLIMCKKIDASLAETLRLLTVTEFIDYLQHKKLPGNVEARKEFCSLIILPKPAILVGSEAKLFRDTLISKEELGNKIITENKTIRGTGIYPAIVKGHVQLIKNVKDLISYQSDKILVTTATLPQYSQYIRHAKCVVADEGGLLTHAAVFSREFKVPAVVGTKIATKVLKDGDLVEVDSINGIITIIKNE